MILSCLFKGICTRVDVNSLRANSQRYYELDSGSSDCEIISTQSSKQGQTHCRHQYSPSAALNIALQGLC